MVLACSERELAKEHEDGVGQQRDKLEEREHDWGFKQAFLRDSCKRRAHPLFSYYIRSALVFPKNIRSSRGWLSIEVVLGFVNRPTPSFHPSCVLFPRPSFFF